MTALPGDKGAQEDRVVQSLIDHLQAVGIPAMLVERPDRLREGQRTYQAVTSDALLRVTTTSSPEDWAVDVMSLASPADHHIVPAGLHQRLEPLATQQSVVIEATGSSPRSERLAHVEREVAQVLAASNRGQVTVDGLQITWRPPVAKEQPGFQITAMLLSAPSSDLVEQVEATIRTSLTRKSTVQAERAHDAGCRTAVLLDWLGHSGIAQGTHWLPQHAWTIQQAVIRVLGGLGHALDAVLLLDRAGDWHLLYGTFPGLSEP